MFVIIIFNFVTVLYYTRIHNGHRLLLSTSCLLTNSRIVVGVSDENLLVNKTLGELIEPLEVRMRNVAEFIEDIKPGRWGGGGGGGAEYRGGGVNFLIKSNSGLLTVALLPI